MRVTHVLMVSTLVASVLSISTLSGSMLLAQTSDQKPPRRDGAVEIAIPLDGSLQNAAWSPSGTQLVFTRFRSGYNKSPADIFFFDLRSKALRPMVDDGETNVSQPGSTWNARTDRIVFSSTRAGHDEVFMIASQARSDAARQVTSDEKYMAYEPSLSPDGQSVVFEAHVVNEEGNGIIRLMSVGSGREPGKPENITAEDEDCRQPNWSPAGNAIVYQKKADDQWNLWIYDLHGKQHRRLTEGDGDKTDATFSPDGRFVLYSADNAELKVASLFAIPLQGGRPIRVTDGGVYDGAPSWSPDGKTIVFESAPTRPLLTGWRAWMVGIWERLSKIVRPEGPTRLWKIDTPEALLRQLCLSGASCRGT
jgi:TolB protein